MKAFGRDIKCHNFNDDPEWILFIKILSMMNHKSFFGIIQQLLDSCKEIGVAPTIFKVAAVHVAQRRVIFGMYIRHMCTKRCFHAGSVLQNQASKTGVKVIEFANILKCRAMGKGIVLSER